MKSSYATKQMLQSRFNSIEQEYSKWKSAHKDLSKYINPLRGRFDDTPNRGTMIDHKVILDGHATNSNRILASGMQSGMTSPTRPWFKVRIKDRNKMKILSVQMWCDDVTNIMQDVCSGSNIYSVFYSMYEEIGQFGVAAALILEDIESVIRGRSFTCGEYFLGINEKGEVDTFGRKYQMQVNQIVKKFGIENCSENVQNLYKTDKMDVWITVNHIIEPNDKKVEGFVDEQNMAFRSVYWEPGQTEEILAFKGFEDFPLLAPRWDTVTTDTIYGYGPGWNALGNVKQLQKTHLDKLLAQEKSHNPPVQKDSSVEGHVNLLPGGVTSTSSSLPNAGVRPSYQVNANLESFIELINSLRESINKDFFVDLFLMMVNFDKSNMTATEVAERQQEKIMMMGPVLEKLQNEMLDPFLERLFNILDRNMLLPPPSEEISEMKLEVEYVSILAQAQKAVGVNAISRVLGFIGGVSPLYPAAADNIDIDEAVREVAMLENIPARLIPTKKIVEDIRAQRNKAEQTRNNLAGAESISKSAKNFANAKLEKESALSRLSDSAPQIMGAISGK